MGNSATACCACCVDRGIELTHSCPVKPNVCHTMCIGALNHDDVRPGIERHLGKREGVYDGFINAIPSR